MGLISKIFGGGDAPDYGPIAEANKEAARLNLEATKEALALQREMFDRTVTLLEPWRAEGRRAQEAMRDVLAKGPAGFGAEYTPYEVDRSFNIDVKADPGYEFRLEQGRRSVEQAQNAQGYNKLGGTAQKALMKFNQQMASDEYGQGVGASHGRGSHTLQSRHAGASGGGSGLEYPQYLAAAVLSESVWPSATWIWRGWRTGLNQGATLPTLRATLWPTAPISKGRRE